MMTAQENDLLCRVEGDAPMGQLMRRHWTPVCLIEEVSEPDGTPVKARVFGEDLVVFRDTDGRVGVMDEFCPHRARVARVRPQRGSAACAACTTAGRWTSRATCSRWCPSRPPAAWRRRSSTRPIRRKEWGGLVWAYMGPQDSDAGVRAAGVGTDGGHARQRSPRSLLPCNWAQMLEGAIDSAHSSSLHSSDMVPARVDSAKATDKTWLRPSTDKAPRMQVQRTGYGFRYAALRRPISNAATNDYVRSTVFVAPATALIPPNNLYNVANINVPMDDTNTAFYFIAWGHPAQTPETETWRKFLRQTVGIDLDATYRPLRNLDNSSGRTASDEGRQLHRHHRLPEPGRRDVGDDGPDRRPHARSARRERPRDRRVPQADARCGARVRSDGQPAIGTGEDAITPAVCAFQAIVPKTTDWRTYEARSRLARWAGASRARALLLREGLTP